MPCLRMQSQRGKLGRVGQLALTSRRFTVSCAIVRLQQWRRGTNVEALARKRTLVSVGTHDLDTVKGPFKYDAVPRKDITFVPLKEEAVWDGLADPMPPTQNSSLLRMPA